METPPQRTCGVRELALKRNIKLSQPHGEVRCHPRRPCALRDDGKGWEVAPPAWAIRVRSWRRAGCPRRAWKKAEAVLSAGAAAMLLLGAQRHLQTPCRCFILFTASRRSRTSPSLEKHRDPRWPDPTWDVPPPAGSRVSASPQGERSSPAIGLGGRVLLKVGEQLLLPEAWGLTAAAGKNSFKGIPTVARPSNCTSSDFQHPPCLETPLRLDLPEHEAPRSSVSRPLRR